jgi:arsenate reductase (thioredoxin)
MIQQKVLFLCTHNSSRTQMAAGFLRHLAGDRFDVISAGGSEGELSPAAIDAMREVGIDISGNQSKDVAKYLGQRFTYVIHLCDRRKERDCPIFPGAIYRLHWDLNDPRNSAHATRKVRDEIRRHVEDFVQKHG